MVGRMSGNRERQSVAIHDRHDFHAFSASDRANLLVTSLRRGQACVDVALRLVQLALIAQNVRHLCERGANDLATEHR
jgi:hypothetical protein